MSCWVAPSIAAELWGISIEQVMIKARGGEIPSCTEHGFFLVDLAPEVSAPPAPVTFTPISDMELAALSDDAPSNATNQPVPQPDPMDEESASIEDWREVRRRMGRIRVPPRPQTPPGQARSFAA